MAKICWKFMRSASLSSFVLYGVLFSLGFCMGSPAFADDDPFALETGHWMSFDHYKDASKHGTLDLPPLKNTSESEAPQPPPGVAPPAQSAIAAPSRPINLPVMPGINKGFNVEVNTTEDEQTISAPSPDLEAGEQNVRLLEKNWQSPISSMQGRTLNTASQNTNTGDDEAPLAVRLSYLPDVKISPVEKSQPESAEHLARIAFEKGMKPQIAQKTTSQPAVCAALDALKKQQLSAIQSDRETLQALQDAIASLGLQKQLGFIAGQASSLNASQPSSQANIDIPASTTVR